jgi:hypothetical protein
MSNAVELLSAFLIKCVDDFLALKTDKTDKTFEILAPCAIENAMVWSIFSWGCMSRLW